MVNQCLNYSGSSKCKWIRIPSLVYSSHVMTTVLPIVSHIGFHDFSQTPAKGPVTVNEKLCILAIYSPFLFIPTLMLIKMLLLWNMNDNISMSSSRKSK